MVYGSPSVQRRNAIQVNNGSGHIKNFVEQHFPWGNRRIHEYSLGGSGSLGRRRTGVLGTAALAAALISALVLAEPAEAQLTCLDRGV